MGSASQAVIDDLATAYEGVRSDSALQRTTVSLDLYLVVDPPEWLPVDAERIRIDHPSLAFNTTFETDVFGERREAGGFVGDAVPGRRAAGRDSPNLRR